MTLSLGRAATLAATAAMLAACGTGGTSGTGGTDSEDPAPPTVARPAFTAAAPPTAVTGSGPITDNALLAGRMISIADLPPGYTGYELPPLDPSSPGANAEDRSSTDPAECAAVLAPIATQVPSVISSASVTFSGPGFSSIDQDAASYDGSGAITAFTAVQDSLARCSNFSGTDADGVRVDYRVSASTLLDDPAVRDGIPAIGDASVAVRIDVVSDGVSLTTDAVVSLVGSTVTQLVASGTEPVDPDLVRALARTAADRLR